MRSIGQRVVLVRAFSPNDSMRHQHNDSRFGWIIEAEYWHEFQERMFQQFYWHLHFCGESGVDAAKSKIGRPVGASDVHLTQNDVLQMFDARIDMESHSQCLEDRTGEQLQIIETRRLFSRLGSELRVSVPGRRGLRLAAFGIDVLAEGHVHQIFCL